MKKIAIIGAGIGGLTLANRLQAEGFQVTLFEKNKMVGGHAYPLKKNGYTFDLGPSLITAPNIIRRIFEAAGKSMDDYIQLTPLDPFYRIYFHDGSFIDYSGNAESMKQQMGQFHPADAASYDRFMKYAAQLHKKVIEEGLGSRPFYWRTLFQFAPKALQLRVPVPSYYVVKSFFKDPRNVFTFSFNTLFIGGSPFYSPAVYLMIPYLEKEGGVWYTQGGLYSLIQAFEKLFLDLGGEIKTSTEVTEIVVRERKAVGVTANGDFYPADAVVSNAHFAHTYLDLIKPEHRRKWTDGKVKRMAYSMSAFILYLGLKKKYPQLRHHTLIIAKRYRGLIRDIFNRKILADDFSMYCHTPTRTDASMAPEGKESMYILIPVPNLLANIDWDQQAGPFSEKVLKFLEEDFGLTDLRKNIEVLELFTPKDFSQHCNNYLGSAWGLEPRVTQTAVLRPRNRSEDVEGLYLVGASTHPGAGVPGVMLTSEATRYAMLADLGST